MASDPRGGRVTPCRLCGSTDFALHRRKDGFRLGRCRRCSLVQVLDDLSSHDPARFYDRRYFETEFGWQRGGGGRAVHDAKLALRLEEIERLEPGRGALLDVGCALGRFLALARERGWDVAGVEPSPYAARAAREEEGLDVLGLPLARADLPEHHFDVVTAWDVIEHLDDPVGDLRRVHRALRPGGLLVFNTPDVDAYLTKLQGPFWRNYEPPSHITYWSRRTVDRLLEDTGFRLVRRTVALPREALLKRLRLFSLLRSLRASDKLLVFARKLGRTKARSDGPGPAQRTAVR